MLVGISFIICSLIYMLLLCIVYFLKKRLKTIETNIYSILLILNVIGLILELLCCYTVSKMDTIPILNIICNRSYLVYFASFVTLFTIYIYLICFKSIEVEKNIKISLSKIEKIVFIFIYITLIICVLFLKLYYHNETNMVYSYGPATDVLTYSCGVFMFIDFICIIINIKKLNKKKLIPMVALLVLFIIAFVVRHINPGIILITCSFAFVTAIMYFTIENPDMKMVEQLNMLKDQADKANRAKTDFLSSMSHEIRTPLNAIVGMSEDISTYEGELPEQIREDASDIQVASQNLLEIVGNILDISKIESEKMEIAELSYNFKEDAKALAKINAVRIGDKHIDFNVDIAEDIPDFLLGDKIHVKEVLNNLVSNAIKYTESGFVNFTCKCINQGDICNLIISVQDSGRGIKQEDINKLFNKFERLGVERNTTTEGTGLGLAITKKLVEMMGGKITVTSTYGQGSIFMVNIPQKIDRNAIMSQNSDVIVISDVTEVDYSTKHVLVVDDNPLNIKVANRALANLNMQIDSVNSGQECIDKINAGNVYDVILMDIMMPGMSGETTLANLKANPAFTTPVIALTADAVSGAREKYLSTGFVDYIAKPFNKDQIKEKLDLIFKK